MELLPEILGWAVLLPLISFVVIFLAGPRMGKAGSLAGWVATLAIVSSCFLSLCVAFPIWLVHHWPHDASHGAVAQHDTDGEHDTDEDHDAPAHHDDGNTDGGHAENDHQRQQQAAGGDHDKRASQQRHDEVAERDSSNGETDHAENAVPLITGDWYELGRFGPLRLTIGFYIDSLTVCMFCMVTLIASCIHFYAMGYMRDELHDFEDPEVTMSDGSQLIRPGRYHRFFQAMSLFSFSMLGLVISGNVAMTFVFWELVGICSYFLIGFYVERTSASTAANKAFIVNRVGDFGMIIGMMAIWASLGTFAFGDIDGQSGIFSLVRPESSQHALVVPDGMVVSGAKSEVGELVDSLPAGTSPEEMDAAIAANIPQWRDPEATGLKGGYGYWLLVIAGIGIFCGCVGKSAQFPLHVWLPDAMEGPTPVSALVHSATMVAAGVYLVARFYPVFAPEVLLVIAVTGCITLFLAATIAITATDIKRVLAYSTVSQLGYMMMALGVGGWLAGTLHLFTHAFFKSLLFMCSGSVIHGVHTNELPLMGGLRHKMPYTAYTMLIGCLAIAGAGLPFVIGFSGYYSKDAILEQALLFGNVNPGFGKFFFFAAAGGAAITAFYMFRLWYLTFAGEPRDPHRYDHAHESPPVMIRPLLVLSVFAVAVAWPIPGPSLSNLLEQSRPAGTLADTPAVLVNMVWPNERDSHASAIKIPATLIAFSTALAGFLLATVMYCWKKLDAEDVRRQFAPIHRFLINKWWFDELYESVFIKPTLWKAKLFAAFDRNCIDWLVDNLALSVRRFAVVWEYVGDRTIVDGFVDKLAAVTYSTAVSMRRIQTGSLRTYVVSIVVGMVIVFVLVSWGYTWAS